MGNWCGPTRGQGEVFDEIVAGLESCGGISPYRGAYRDFSELEYRFTDHELLAVVLQEMLLARGVKLLLHTRFVDVVVEKNRIAGCVLAGKSGPEGLAARQFVDASGEADLARAAGFETVAGRPGDGLALPMSMMFFVREVAAAEARAQVPEGKFETFPPKESLPMTSIWRAGPGRKAVKVKLAGFDAADTESLSAAEVAGRRRMMAVLDYFQRVEKKPWLLDHASAQIAIREGRRVVGDYVLSVEDLRAGRRFEDAVARGVFYLDAHEPTTDKHVAQIPDEAERSVPPYQIPLRSLTVRGADNLLAAGRCLSADHLAQASARVATTCSMLGAAAGVAAALAAERGCPARELPGAEVRKIVETRGARLEVP